MDIEKNAQITIDNQIIPMKLALETFGIYKQAFKTDFMSAVDFESNRKEVNVNETLERVLQVMWSLTKTANPKTQRFNKWKKLFSNYTPMETIELFEELSDQLLKSGDVDG